MKTIAIYLIVIGIIVLGCNSNPLLPVIMTVNGPINPSELGSTLIHEHVFLDWTGADSINPSLWDSKAAFNKILPYLIEMKKHGVVSFLECTPAYLGRNPVLLKKLADAADLNILTNTGYYGARKNEFIPSAANEMSIDQMVEVWVEEWENGIENTGIRPGFIKISVDSDSVLSEMHKKIVRAAARTHLKTGLTIVGHTGPELPAFAQLEILREEGVDPSAFVWTHAQRGSLESHVEFAKKGGWVSLDGIGWLAPDTTSNPGAHTLQRYVSFIKNLKNNQCLHRTLISHDAGWFTFGAENGGEYRPHTAIFERLIPCPGSSGIFKRGYRSIIEKKPGGGLSGEGQEIQEITYDINSQPLESFLVKQTELLSCQRGYYLCRTELEIMEDSMIKVSDAALTHIGKLRTDQGFDETYGLRVSVEGGGCSGLAYKLDFDNKEQPGDQVIEDKGVKIFVNMKSLLYLVGTELDYTGGIKGEGFHFANPNASRTCACGESFSV